MLEFLFVMQIPATHWPNIKKQDIICQCFSLAYMQMYCGWRDGKFETLKLDCRALGHTYSPLCQFFEMEPWDRQALMAKQLMSTLDLRESFWIMWHWVPESLLHKNRWSQGHPSLLSPSPPVLSISHASLPPFPLSRSPSTIPSAHTRKVIWAIGGD